MGSVIVLVIIGTAMFFAFKKLREERKRGGCSFCPQSGNCASQSTCPNSKK